MKQEFISRLRDSISISNSEFQNSYIWQKDQRYEFLTMLVTFVFLYIIISVTYPYPATMADSGNYILSAKTTTINAYRPIGYSWFIYFIHFFSHKISAIFTGQFIFNAFSQIVFLFTIKYFFQLRKFIYYLLSTLLILSPSILFCTNYIMSDSIFNSLTLLYITSSLWILKQPNIRNITVHLIILYVVINVRYAALFYPILSVVIFLYHIKKNILFGFVSILPIVITIFIYVDTKSRVKEIYHVDEFSPFSGWAMANNAVSVIPHINLRADAIEDKENKFIHQVVSSFPDSIYQFKYIRETSFMWNKEFPGKQILFYTVKQKQLGYSNSWAFTGQKFKKYGSFLIKKYPLEYFKYYLYPNFKQLFSSYKIPNVRVYKPDKLSTGYFNLDFDEFRYHFSFLHKFNSIRKVFTPLLWILFIVSVFALLGARTIFKKDQKILIAFVLIFILCYAGFSVIAHPINNFRYLIPIYSLQLLIISIVLKERNNIFSKIRKLKTFLEP